MQHVYVRSFGIALLLLVTLSVWGTIAEAGELKPGTPNTITLANGEVVWDLNGEWLAEFELEDVPTFGFEGPGKDIIIIVSQKNNQFVGYSLMSNEVYDKRGVVFRGELGNNGFKKVYLKGIYHFGGALTNTEWISKEGKKIVFEAELDAVAAGEVPYKITLIRK